MTRKISEKCHRRSGSRSHPRSNRRCADASEAVIRCLNAALQRKFRRCAARRPGVGASLTGLARLLGIVLVSLPFVATRAAEPAPRVLLLGEVHDNAAGHAARLAWLRTTITERKLRPALAMEQFDRERQPLLDQALADCRDADCVIAKAGQGSWDWPLYRPLIQYALDEGLPLLAANVSRDDARRAMKDGLGAVLDAETRRRHHAEAPVPADIVAAQHAEIIGSHCGQLPEAVARRMVDAQVARDIWMARMVANGAAQRGSAVLIAGNGHVRRDVGVPRWLPPALAATAEVHGFVESEPVAGEFDVVHRVAPQPRPDPCEGMNPG